MKRESGNRHRRWENRPLVREVDRHRARWYWGILLGMVLAAIPGVVYIVEQNACLQLQYRASALRTERDQLLERERRLRVRRAGLESLSFIETWALDQRGLERPARGQVIVVRQTIPQAGDLVARRPETTRGVH